MPTGAPDNTDQLKRLLAQMEYDGAINDSKESVKAGKFLNITRETGEFIAFLASVFRAKTVLELGTSNGYSTIWLASAVGSDGIVVTVERQSWKIERAYDAFVMSGLSDRIEQVQNDAGEAIAIESRIFDLVFLDADRREYVNYIDDISRVLRPGGLLICDNATSHPEDLQRFIAIISDELGWATCTVPIGNGEFLAVKPSEDP